MPKTIKTISLVDRLQIPTKRKFTDAGQMIVPCAFARTGMQEYTSKSLGLEIESDDLVKVMRDASEVFAEDSMASFRSAPLTLGHPKIDGESVSVTAENSKDFQKGFLEGMPTRDEDTLVGTLVVSDKEAIEAIESGSKELSAGYTCDIVLKDDGSYEQANIRANHIAIVDKGRAGSLCRIADEEEPKDAEVEEAKDGEAEEAAPEEKAPAEAEPEKKVEDASLLDKGLEISRLVDERVKATLGVLIKASTVIDEDLSDLCVQDIMKKVITKVKPKLSLTDKSEAYVEALFDLCFDDEIVESPMTSILKKHISDMSEVIDEEKKVDEVLEARKRMITRNNKKEG